MEGKSGFGEAESRTQGTERRTKRRAGGFYTPPDVEAEVVPLWTLLEISVGVFHWSTSHALAMSRVDPVSFGSGWRSK